MNKNGKPKQAVLYGRRSPQRDANEETGPQRQIEDLRTWCAANDYEVVGEFTDEALSGGDAWDERPGMLEASKVAKRGMTILVRSYDRLFRDTDKALAFRAMMEAKGVDVLSITEPTANGNDMHAKLMRYIFLWVAEYQREVIRARTKTRMLQYQASGRRMSKLPPWGTRQDPNDPARLVPDKEEQRVTRIIVEQHEAGASLREICQHLEHLAILRRGKKRWNHVIVQRIIERAAQQPNNT